MVIRFVISVVYAYLLVAMSGFFDLANAVVSCTDVISSQTTYRYNEALYGFKYFNGKTYAVALSAVTGGTTAPDNYFAFSPNFTREYIYGGTDTTSLKTQLASGIFGAARPVAITDDSVKKFILDHYGAYLTSSSGTLVDAWKEYGDTAPYTRIDGSTLSTTYWGTAPAASTEPSAVAMDSTGAWAPVSSGTYSKQIVEFDGQLDCAIDPSAPYTPPPTTTPTTDQTTLNDLANYNGLICMGDLNNDGSLSGPGEVGKCASTSLGDFCPVGALDCNTSFQPPTCPPGSTLNTDRNMCQADQLSVSCPSGYTWDSSIDKCVVAPTCPDGGTFNTVTDRCEKVATDTCPTGYTNAGNNLCTKAIDCGTGTYNPTADRCETAAVAAGCAAGLTYNATANRCEAAPLCANGGTYNTTYNKCLQPVSVCANGYSWNTTRQRCEKTPPECPAGSTYNLTTNRCEANPTCSSGTYDPATNQCKSASSYAATVSSVAFSVLVDYHKPLLWQCTSYDRSGCNMGDWLCGRCVASQCIADSQSGILEVNGTADGCSSPSVVGYAAATSSSVASIPIGTSRAYGPYVIWGTTYYGCNATSGLVLNPTGDAQCPPTVSGYISPNIFTSSVSFPGGGGYLSSVKTTTSIYTCPSGGTLSGTTCNTTSYSAATCPSGTSLDGTSDKCVANPTCTGGTFDGTADVCYYTATACNTGAGEVYDAAAGQCSLAATCAGGTLDTTADLCIASLSAATCPTGYTEDISLGLCYSTSVCAPGSYVSANGRCEAAVTKDCSAYTWDTVVGKCIQAPTCPTDASFSLASTIAYAPTLDKCMSQAIHTCPADTTWNTVPVGKCEAAPICAGAVYYDQATHQCFVSASCPYGSQYTCMPNSVTGTYQCSPYQCVNASAGEGVTLEPFTESSMKKCNLL